MELELKHVQVAFIGQLPEAIFRKLKEQGIVTAANAEAEHQQFEDNFLAACAEPDAKNPPQIPAYRLFTPYAAEGQMSGYFLNPFASKEAFYNDAALECCDVRVQQNGLVTTVAIDANPIAIIHNDGQALSIKPISADPDILGMSFTSNDGASPLTLDIQSTGALVTL